MSWTDQSCDDGVSNVEWLVPLVDGEEAAGEDWEMGMLVMMPGMRR